MAKQFHIAGPLDYKIGGTSFGRADGDSLFAYRIRHAVAGIPTDQEGGGFEDYVQGASRLYGLLTLPVWDQAEVPKVIGVLKTISSPAVAEMNEAGAVGLLRFADRNTPPALVIRGTKITASNGMNQLTINKFTLDPEGEVEQRNIGWKHSTLVIPIIAHPDSSGRLYELAAIT